MANTLSHSYTFDKTLPIDEIVEESYERIGIINVSGYQLKTAKRSLNLLFSEWSNRALHYWEIANQGFTLVDGTNVYTTYRSPADGASQGLTTTLLTIPLTGAVSSIDPYIPDNGVLFNAGAYVNLTAADITGVTVYYDG